MKTVAENFDDVLLVSRASSGNHPTLGHPTERDQLVTDELTASLRS